MTTAYLLLGSNLGNRVGFLQDALQLLAATAGFVRAVSARYETAAWGLTDQPAFLNQAVQLETHLPPIDLLAACLHVEQQAGRERHIRWDARTLDVDILLYDDLILDSPQLQVPHPRLPERRFALVPLAEIAAHVVHPEVGVTVAELLAACGDELNVKPLVELL
ncbi:2-amino-4-hydroxy-6-hydroxymethyldihydropteridine diphosphokinase [Hymenobacter elongatus]|uniref:2-amino-4-hydroxy-6-hydroxymethyldihydropteridine pyrophosphokinase n=1 Tax=Hymenobacter elongatus TaxID=877208 RepID=A0A4Z0PGD2_9BACT|nr:2-amino-4-hydroxy-6-hydroxymethyldihydropteridine diphosphokinase [Hymenobacter elongatus]TGE14194.1 2-amino-4-hydroxy-6-hydroxymethyldihydropteridine diphosphokinase [Hymenobacter elongatus]